MGKCQALSGTLRDPSHGYLDNCHWFLGASFNIPNTKVCESRLYFACLEKILLPRYMDLKLTKSAIFIILFSISNITVKIFMVEKLRDKLKRGSSLTVFL